MSTPRPATYSYSTERHVLATEAGQRAVYEALLDAEHLAKANGLIPHDQLATGAPSMHRHVSDLPEHLQTRIPQALLDLEPRELVARLSTAVLNLIDTSTIGGYDPEVYRPMVASLKEGTLDVSAALSRFDLRAGLSSLVYSLLNHARDLKQDAPAVRYAHAHLDMRTAIVHCALFYNGLRPRARVARSKLYTATVERYDATILTLSTAAGVAA